MSTETVPKGYKRTEVGVIPEEWEVCSLEELSGFITKGSTPTTYGFKWETSGVLFLRSECASAKGLDLSESMWISEAAHRVLKRSEVTLNDILMTITGYVGRVALFDIPTTANINQHIARIRIKSSEAESKYIYHTLAQSLYSKHYNSIVTGNAYPQISLRQVRETPICLPPIQEQQAIAAALSDADALIESLESLLAKKRQIKQGAMQELLTGKRRLPGFTGKWCEAILSDFLLSAPDYGINAPGVPDSGAYPKYLRITDITDDGRFAPPVQAAVNHPESARYILSKDEIVFARTGASVGKSYLYKEADGELVFAGFLIRAKIDPSKISPEYLAAYTHTAEYWNWVRLMSMRSGQPGINGQEYASMTFCIPPTLPEQTAIASVLSDMDTELEALEAKLEKARQVKQGMMQELLTGKIRLVSSQPKETEVPFLVAAETSTSKAHNQPFNEAVLISVLAGRYGTSQFPLSRFRYTKFLYLFHRHVDHVAQGFRKKAAGPYNPDNRYKGPETIAQKNGYMVRMDKGFVAGPKNADALGYYENWYPLAHLEWLDRFRFAKNDALEVLTTVDMACEDLRIQGKAINVQTVKALIESEPEWLPKLERAIFSDTGIAAAIRQSHELFGGGSR